MKHTYVSVVMSTRGTLHIVRAYHQGDQVVRKDEVPSGAPALSTDKVVACLVCADEPRGTCHVCGKWVHP